MAKPQAKIFQEASIVPVELTEPLRPLILGGHADLHRYSDAGEKTLIRVGEYNPEEDTCYEWPSRSAGGVVDQDYAKVFIDDALLQYYTDEVDVGATITPVSGRANRIISDLLKFKTSGDYARSTAFHDRDVKIGDVVYLRGVYDPGDTCEEIELWTEVAGFAAAVIDGVVGDATWDDNNAETASASSTITQIAGVENCLVATQDASAYDGLPSGDVTEEYTITVVKSSISGCDAARLRVISASGRDDQDEVTPADFGSPTDIGTRGLTVTWDNTGGVDCSSEASANDAAPTDFVIGQSWRVVITQAFEQVYALSGGDYDGVKDDTYIVEVTKGGLWADEPQITVRTAKGQDVSGPTTVTDNAVEVNVGRKGVTILFFGSAGGASDLSIGADDVAGLRKGDLFYIPVTAPTTGKVDTLLLKHDLPTRMRDLDDLELRLYIKADVELPQNRLSDAPNTNWYTETTQLCVQEGALAYDATWTEDSEQLPLPVKGGTIFIQYREWLQTLVGQMTSYATVSDLDDVAGPLDPDNPFKYGLYYALLNSRQRGTEARGVAVRDPAVLDDWLNALEVVEGNRQFYNFAPMTFNKEVRDAVIGQASTESTATANNFKGVFVGIEGVTTRKVVSIDSSTDGEEVLGTIADNPNATGTQYTLLQVPAGNGAFVTNGVVAGDAVRFQFGDDGFGNESYETFVVDEVLSEDSILLVSGTDVAVTAAQKLEIVHTLNKAEQATHIAAEAQAVSDSKVCACWPDVFGNGGRSLPGYYLAAAGAGLAGSVAPHAPLSGTAVAGVDDLSKSFGYFNNSQLNTMDESGVFIFAEDEDGTPQVRHGVTTDTTSLNKREESMRRNYDSISLFFYNRVKQYAGRVNNTPTFLSKLRWDLKDAISFLKQSNFTDDLGGQLIDGTVVSVTQHPLLLDHVEVYITLQLPAPANQLEIHLVI